MGVQRRDEQSSPPPPTHLSVPLSLFSPIPLLYLFSSLLLKHIEGGEKGNIKIHCEPGGGLTISNEPGLGKDLTIPSGWQMTAKITRNQYSHRVSRADKRRQDNVDY